MWKPFVKKKQEEHRSLQLITQRGMPFAYVEAYKALRTNISFLTSSQDVHTFIVASSAPEEAKSNVSVNLAVVLAASGKKVILLDCDLRKPILHRYLRAGHNVKGVSNILANQCGTDDAILHLERFNMDFLSAGAPPPNPSELLTQPQMQQLVDELRSKYDYVILDAPPVSVVTDAAIIGRMTDGVLFVVRSDYSSAEVIKDAVKKLQNAGVKILGVVLTRYNVKKSLKSSAYAYGYSYGYAYGTTGTTDGGHTKEHTHGRKSEASA